jgi:hypothetical protein
VASVVFGWVSPCWPGWFALSQDLEWFFFFRELHREQLAEAALG